MTVACIIIKHLPCRVETARDSRLRHDPMVIYDPDAPFQRVVDATPGSCVHPEMPLETALARCPDAVAIPADTAEYARQWRAVINRLRSVIDIVEADDLGTAYAQIHTDDAHPSEEPRTVANLMACIPHDWEPQVGIASDRYAAHCAARIARPGHALRVPDEPDLRHNFLAPLPVNLLPVDVRILAGLYDCGIHRLSQLDDLSAEALEATLSRTANPSATTTTQESRPEIPRAA